MQNAMIMELQYVGYRYFVSKRQNKNFLHITVLICQQNETNTLLENRSNKYIC